MTERDADRLLGILIAATPDWNDILADEFRSMFVGFDDAQALENVINRMTRQESPRRPAMSDVMTAYANEGRYLERHGRTGRMVSFDEGIQLAWDAYRKAAMLDGKEPNRAMFGRLIQGLR